MPRVGFEATISVSGPAKKCALDRVATVKGVDSRHGMRMTTKRTQLDKIPVFSAQEILDFAVRRRFIMTHVNIT
jgi:hypothetical protein